MGKILLDLLVALIATNGQFDDDADGRDVSGADLAEEHVVAATEAAQDVDHPQVTPSLLLAMAAIESNYNPTAVSRVQGGKRVTGMWGSTRPVGSGPRFCGVLQTIAGHQWGTCLAQRELSTGYLAGAKEMVVWLKVAKGDLRAALRGHGCGMWGLRNRCNNYDVRVLRVKHRLDKMSKPEA